MSLSSEPMSYNTLTREFSIYSEDFSLIGFRTIEVQAYFIEHQTMTSAAPNLETVIEIEHPCLRTASITVRDSQTANPYYY